MIFGQGCYDIEVTQFTPICDYPEIPPSSPKTFEVPLHPPVIPTPPGECVCFEFDPIKASPSPSGCREPVCYVEIVQDGQDCCTGKYRVTPHIEFPCLPFTINDANITVTFADDEHEVGGSLRFSSDCDNCSLTPEIDVVLPEYPRYCFEVKGDNGAAYEDQVSTQGVRGKDKPVKALSGEGGEPMPPFKIKAKYQKDASSEPIWSEEAELTITSYYDTEDACPCYEIGSTVLDLTPLVRPFGGDGDVFINDEPGGGGGGGGGPVLRINGDPDDDKEPLYGGGYGDLEYEMPAEPTFRRGPIMRCGDPDCTSPASKQGYRDKIPVPVATDVEPWLETKDSKKYKRWSSGSFGDDGQFTPGEYRLNMTLGSGYQWHERGLAVVLSTFEWTPSGVLSWEEENNEAVLISPAPSYIEVVEGGYDKKYYGASGLCIYNDNGSRTDVKHGLAVIDGRGIRIRGVDTRTPDYPVDSKGNAWNYKKGDQGALEVQYGKGLRVISGKDPETGEPTYEEKPSSEVGALELNVGSGDVALEEEKGRLMFNDKMPTTIELLLGNNTPVPQDPIPEGHTLDNTSNDEFARNAGMRTGGEDDDGCEIVIPILIPIVGDGMTTNNIYALNSDNPWNVDPDNGEVGVDNMYPENMCLAYLRFSKTGALLSVSKGPWSMPAQRATDPVEEGPMQAQGLRRLISRTRTSGPSS